MEDYTGCFNKMDLLLEFCTGPGPAKGPNTTRPADRAGPANMGWSFQRAGPGRRMRGDFSIGPGRAGTWEVIFQTGQAGPADKKRN